MNAKHIREMISLLRTTTHKQYFGGLTGPSGGYCAIGVLWDARHCPAAVYRDAANWLGIREGKIAGGEQPEPHTIAEIIAMNDERRMTFGQIADALEGWLPHSPAVREVEVTEEVEA
jgi:hypothetical protein